MANVLSDRQERIFLELHELWELGSRERLSVIEIVGASGLKLISRAMTREWAAGAPEHRGMELADVEDFETAGLIAIDWELTETGKRGDFRITSDGVAYVRRLTAAPSEPPPPIGLEWEGNVLPVLRAIYEVEQVLAANAHGASRADINRQLQRPLDDPATDRVLERLSSGGYLAGEMTVEEIDAPLYCRLSEKGLQQVAKWPGAPQADLTSQFLDLLDAKIADSATSEEERARLTRLRDAAGEVGQGVLTSLLAAVIKSQTGI